MIFSIINIIHQNSGFPDRHPPLSCINYGAGWTKCPYAFCFMTYKYLVIDKSICDHWSWVNLELSVFFSILGVRKPLPELNL